MTEAGARLVSRAGWKITAAVSVLFALATGLVVRSVVSPDVVEERAMTTQGSPVNPVTRDDLAKVARTRVFFGHQSVGMNVLDAVPAVFAQHGVAAPPIEQDAARPGAGGGFISHSFIGENEKPLEKIRDFDAKLRGGLAQQVDVAMMKFCYIDIRGDTDVEGLFAAYRDTLAALERDFPTVTFVKVTVPLTTEAGVLSRLKARLGTSGRFGQAENVARERLNALIRRQYAGDHLFDLAAVESTTQDGMRSTARYNGQQYYVLDDAYASDLGHLNAEGAQRAATAWLKLLAQVSLR